MICVDLFTGDLILDKELNVWLYVQALISRWLWIIGAFALATVITFTIVTLLPETYESTTLILIINPEVVVLESLTPEKLDPRFNSITDEDPLRNVYPELAMSDKIMVDLLAQVDSQLEDVSSVERLRNLLSAEVGNDAALLQLTVQYSDPVIVAEIANSWADLFVPWANEMFSPPGEQQAQLTVVSTKLQNAEDVLSLFQGQNRSIIISNILAARTQTQADFLSQQRQILLLLQDVQALHDQLAASNSSNVTLADQLTVLNLQLRAFNSEAMSLLGLQVTADEPLTGANRQDQLAFLDNLLVTLESKNEQIIDLLATLDPEILLLQQQNLEAETEHNRLLRQRNVADETYTALVRRAVEESVSDQNAYNGLRLASQAIVPSKPIDSNRILNTLVAGIATFLASIFFVLATVWWQQTVRENIEGNNE